MRLQCGNCGGYALYVYAVPLSDNLSDPGIESDDLRLSMLPVLVARLIFSDPPPLSSSSSSSSDLCCCSWTVIFSSMSPITWKLGSTMKSMKPAIHTGDQCDISTFKRTSQWPTQCDSVIRDKLILKLPGKSTKPTAKHYHA